METTNHRSVPAGELCNVNVSEGIMVELFRSGKYTGNREGVTGFRPSKVLKGGAAVWEFQTSGANKELGQAAELYEFGEDGAEELLIAICDRTTIFSVIRVADFAHAVMAKLKGKAMMLGGSSPERLLLLKIELARSLGMQYWFDADEGVILRKKTEEANRASAAAKAEEESRKAAARAEREAFAKGVLARRQVEAWDNSGKHFFGIPVESDAEWMCLPDDKYCIFMKDGQPVEAFRVDKKNSKVKKFRPTEVSGNRPVMKSAGLPEALDQKTVTLKGETRSILVFSTMEEIKRLQNSGLNSGTWVGQMSPDGRELTVVSVKAKSLDTIGVLRASAPA